MPAGGREQARERCDPSHVSPAVRERVSHIYKYVSSFFIYIVISPRGSECKVAARCQTRALRVRWVTDTVPPVPER